LLGRVRKLQDELDALATLHLSQIWGEVAAIHEQRGVTPVEYVARCGLLSPRLMAAHGRGRTAEEEATLGASGAAVAINPAIAARRGLAARIDELERAGCLVTLGTDNMAEDMVEVVRTAMFMERVRRADGRQPTPEQALTWATRNGYRALGVPDGGWLAPGNRADFILGAFRRPHLTPRLPPSICRCVSSRIPTMPVLLAILLARHGYAIVFLGVFLESAGVPVPGETVLLAAGFFASQGTFALPWVIGLGIGAAILGDNVGYWIGRRAGRPLVERYGRLVGLTPGRIAAFDAFFQRHGARTVFLARFVTGLRVVAALFAGVARLPWSEFLLYNAAGALVWATTVTLAGYFFGRSWELLHRWFGRAALFGAALAIALVVVALARRFGGPLFAFVVAKLPASLARRELAFAAASLGFVAVFTKIAED